MQAGKQELGGGREVMAETQKCRGHRCHVLTSLHFLSVAGTSGVPHLCLIRFWSHRTSCRATVVYIGFSSLLPAVVYTATFDL